MLLSWPTSSAYDDAGVAAAEARGVLPGHGVPVDQLGSHRAQRLENLELLVADRLAVDVGRRLHRDEADQLEQVVLHHVAQRAGAVVVGAALTDAERLRDGDLHVVDPVAVPQRLEEGVGEARDQEVLDALLAEVVVDAEDVGLVEDPAHGLVDRLGRRQVGADGLLEDDPGTVRGQADLVEVLADRAEQRRRHREVEHADDVVGRGAVLEPVVEPVPGTDVLDVEGHVVQAAEQAADDGVGELVGRDVLGEGPLDHGAIAVVVDLGARDADDPEPVGELAVAVAEVEGGEQLAEGEVSGATEDGEVARLDGSARGVRLAGVSDRRSVHGSPPYGVIKDSDNQTLVFFVRK